MQEHTFEGVSHWYKSVFERLGWIVLGDQEKLFHYKQEIIKLQRALDSLVAIYESVDKRHDLNVMAIHVDQLSRFVMTAFH
jgi:hypothetical protein